MPDFESILLRNIGVPDVQRLDVYQSRGGYRAVEKAIRQHAPDDVVKVVTDSKLRGRGGAGFPCGQKWGFLPPARTTTYMCVNADESEPGTFNNRILMEEDPHQVLESIILACYATRASTAYLYLRYEYGKA